MTEYVMMVSDHGSDCVWLDLGHLRVRAPGSTWQGPGLPKNGGTARVVLDNAGNVRSVTPISPPDPIAQMFATAKQAREEIERDWPEWKKELGR